jgi:hypothetical protein
MHAARSVLPRSEELHRFQREAVLIVSPSPPQECADGERPRVGGNPGPLAPGASTAY